MDGPKNLVTRKAKEASVARKIPKLREPSCARRAILWKKVNVGSHKSCVQTWKILVDAIFVALRPSEKITTTF